MFRVGDKLFIHHGRTQVGAVVDVAGDVVGVEFSGGVRWLWERGKLASGRFDGLPVSNGLRAKIALPPKLTFFEVRR